MIAQKTGRVFSIPFCKGGEDGLVFGHGLRQPTPQMQLHPAEGFQPLVKAQRLIFEITVFTRAIDQVVKLFVVTIVTIRIIGPETVATLFVHPSQILKVGIRDAQGRKPATGGFEFGHRLEHLDQIHRAGLAHENAAPWALFNKSRSGKLLQRFPDRGARDAEPLGQFDFIQPFAISKIACHDHLFEVFQNCICAADIHECDYLVLHSGMQDNNACIQKH